MLRAANSIYSSHFAVWPARRSVLGRGVVVECSDSKEMYKKRYAREELFFCFICYPTAFVLLSLPSPSSLHKLPKNYTPG